MSDMPPDLSVTLEDHQRTPIAGSVTLILVLLELVFAIGICTKLQGQTLHQVADLGMELPKATELCLKMGMPGLVVLGAAAGAIVATLNFMLSDGRLRVLVNLTAMTLIVGSCLLFHQILQLAFNFGTNDLSRELQLPAERVLAHRV